jgi:hypothetical protein
MLVERAWSAGAESARQTLSKLLDSPLAATLDANAVAQRVGEWRDQPTLWHQPPFNWGDYEERVLSVVRNALMDAEQNERATES